MRTESAEELDKKIKKESKMDQETQWRLRKHAKKPKGDQRIKFKDVELEKISQQQPSAEFQQS
jgi:hypothetical protein